MERGEAGSLLRFPRLLFDGRTVGITYSQRDGTNTRGEGSRRSSLTLCFVLPGLGDSQRRERRRGIREDRKEASSIHE